MNRLNILRNIKINKPALRKLPNVNLEKFRTNRDLEEEFIKNAEAVGSKVHKVANHERIKSDIRDLFPDVKEIISNARNIDISSVDPEKITSSKDLEKLDLAIIEGQFGVAENGAVWISDKNFSHRSIPFIPSHLIMVLDSKNIVENMHDAFFNLRDFNDGYGVFISGPSKTADIEQSLVIGAQAALSHTIFLI